MENYCIVEQNPMKLFILTISSLLFSLVPKLPILANPIQPEPLFESAQYYTTTITTNGDIADIYYPVINNPGNLKESFPIVLLLQGALVDKADYSNVASLIAQYGFIVAVPNHERSVPAPNGQMIKGLASEQEQILDILTFLRAENQNSNSPIAGLINTNKLGLTGHSFGGYVGLAAIQNRCFANVCSGNFERPPELMAGIFYGTNFREPPMTGDFPPINNDNIPTALISGSLDPISDVQEAQSTYEQIQNPPKSFIILNGANHYGITNEDNLQRDKVRPTLEQSIANETIARWTGLFLRAHLYEDQNAFSYVYQRGDEQDNHVKVIHQIQSSQQN